ncbi:hypothetical protein [Pseudomonas phage Njord]|uniref:Scaffolding protein n=1 Tax=Pseudomonas phage Njord TaxID=2163985 RepID=A0A2S1GMK9_9CAUD|nr:head scaffolding protein [Pseudomonas phage Njord]AWD90616.1 hypothetical protein [Pseudomonas phage Njord]
MERGVEVLNGGAPTGAAPDGIVDLTGSTKQPIVDLTGEGENTNVETQPLVEGDEGYVAPADADAPKLNADGTPATPDPKDQKEPEQEGDAVEFFYGGQSVEIEVPAEISSALTEAGLDEKAVLAELFAKEGKFELTADTRAKLDEKFGKLMVDGYLKMYKGLNDQTMAEATKQAQSASEAQKQIQSEYTTIVGGEEGLGKLEAYVLTLDQKQIDSYNAVMGGDSWDAQKMVLTMLRTQMAAADKQANGDKTISLLGDGDPASLATGDITDKGWLSGAEYQKLMGDDKYWDDKSYQKKVDTMRSASIRAGR